MSALSRRRATLVGVSGLSLAVAGAIAPGAFAADTIDGDVKVSNTETVQVLMNADGSIDSQRIYEQVVLTGNGKVDISNPVSEEGLRNLDGFGGFDVRDGQSRIKTSVDGTKKFRSVSDFTGKLPLKFDITYTLDGKKISPSDVVGKSGELEVRYVVTNLTGVAQEVSFQDGAGLTKSSTEDVVIPMVGSLTTVLPSSFTKVASAEANAAGDGRGGTQLSFTMTLIPPIGNATAEFGYKAQVKDAVIPKASVSALPVNPLESPSFKGGAASYAGGAETGQDLTAGATEIDANVLKLRDGASDLVAGIIQLRDGANQLSAGLTNDAAPGAKKLATGANKLDAGAKQLAGGSGDLSAGAGKLKNGAGDLSAGTGKLSAGADKLNKGAGDLSDGLKKASAGGPQLLEGVAQLKAGAQKVDGGLTALNGLAVPGLNQMNGAATSLIAGITDKINPGLDGANKAIAGARQYVDGSPSMTGPEKTNITGILDQAAGAVTAVKSGLNDTSAPSGFMYGLGAIKKGTADLSAGIDAQTSKGAAANDGTLKNGMAQLIGGLTQLQGKGGELVKGLDDLSAGAGQLKAGTGDLSKGASDLDAGAGQLKAGTGDLKAGADKLNAGAGTLKGGTGQLSIGAAALAEGLGTASAGSAEIAAGLEKAAGSAPALPEGADRLSKEGTSQLIEAGNATASDYGLKYAMIEAGAARAGSAQPYGSPEGATALAAFKFEISGESGADSANLKRGVAAIVLLAAAGVLATVRRRGTI